MAPLRAYSVITSLLFLMDIPEIHSQITDTSCADNRSERNPLNNCGDLMCYCSFDTAHCGGDYNILCYIPILPAEITILDFSDNYLPRINVSSFKNISDIEDLDLLNNYIAHIERKSFQLLHSLKTLSMSKNPKIEATALAEAFSSLNKSTINSIYLRRMHWEAIPENMFYYLNSSKLKTIALSFNKMRHLTFETFSRLKYLAFLNLNNNNLESVDMSLLGNLRTLFLSNNRLSKTPDVCDQKLKKSFFPRLILLYLRGNNFKYLTKESFKCLSRLNTLDLSDNSHILSLGENFLLPLFSLKELDLSSIGSGLIENFAFNSSTIEKFHFKFNYLSKFIFDDNINSVFLNCPQLRILSLSNTVLHLSNHEIVSLLSPLTKLKKLYLDNTKLDNIPEVISKMTSLEILDLSSNKISSWNGTKFFGQISKISCLSLNNNMIFAINETSFPSLLLKSMHKGFLDLRQNPYSCTCQNVNSVNWFRERANILLSYQDNYKCFSPPGVKGKPLENYNPSEESCAEKNIALLVSVPVSFVCIATLLAIVLTYKCRWRLRYGLYLVRNRHKDYHRIEDSDSFVYTGFVIYSDDDRNWVHNELIHRIEDQEGFRLCIRLRDFDVGKVHVDNIVDNMFLSEKIIVVLSNNFAEDEWCRFQLLLAETKLLKQNADVFIVLMLEEVHSDCLRASIYKLVTDGQYALWTNNETGNSLFWEQIVSQMRRPSVIN